MKVTLLLDVIAQVLILVGALNWGLIGLFQVDAVKELVGYSKLATIVYTLVGFAAIYVIVRRFT